jgi:hypothetical protein
VNTTVIDPKAIMSAATVAAIIRKDLRALWPFALTLALVQLVISAFFHVARDYPDITLDIGASHIPLAPTLFGLHLVGLPIAVATFIVLLAHRDPATDARNDWMARPIWALDIVAAKSLVILAVVLVPAAIGNFAYVTMHDNVSIDTATGPIMLTLMGCIFMLVVAWLASSPVQALLAPLVLAIATLLAILTLGVTLGLGVIDTSGRVSRAVEIPAASQDRTRLILPPAPSPPTVAPTAPAPPEAPAGASPAPSATAPVEQAAPAPARVEAIQGRRLASQSRGFVNLAERAPPRIDLTWPIVIAEFLLVLGAAGVVLWLLLVRRRLVAARLTFLGFFFAAILFMLIGGSVSMPKDEMVALTSIARPAPVRPAVPEPQRLAAFANNDTNKDGLLDKTEYSALLDELGFSDQLESLWAQRDVNRDGFVSFEEYRNPIPQ